MRKAKTQSPKVSLVVVGSVALDTVITPSERRSNVLGGSVSYACLAASFFSKVGMVGVIGRDFPGHGIRTYTKAGIDITGLQKADGKTFRWAGEYEADMNNRKTLSTELNVFAGFEPELPESYRNSPFLFLANISPELQIHVLSQVRKPKFVAVDTMDLWIKTAKSSLARLFNRVNLIMVNDSEARMLSGESNLARAASSILGMGPEYVIVKKGEHGAVLFSRSGRFMVPAFPVDNVLDPTGAGDTFAGGFMGFLAMSGKVDWDSLRRAMLYGSVIASFGVEAFSVERLVVLRRIEIARRLAAFERMLALPK